MFASEEWETVKVKVSGLGKVKKIRRVQRFNGKSLKFFAYFFNPSLIMSPHHDTTPEQK